MAIWQLVTWISDSSWHGQLTVRDMAIWQLVTWTTNSSWHGYLTAHDMDNWQFVTWLSDSSWHGQLTARDMDIWQLVTWTTDRSWQSSLTHLEIHLCIVVRATDPVFACVWCVFSTILINTNKAFYFKDNSLGIINCEQAHLRGLTSQCCHLANRLNTTDSPN